MKEVVNKIIERGISADKIGIRLSPNGVFGEMGGDDNIELFTAAIEWLAGKELGFIHVMDGLGFGFHEKTEPFTLKMAMDTIKKKNDKTVLIGNVGYTQKDAEDVIDKGYADMIAFGRPYISNPDLVYRFENGIDLNPDAEYPDWWGWEKNEDGYIDFPIVRPE